MNQPIEQFLDEVDAELKRWGNVAKFRTDTVRRLASELRQRIEKDEGTDLATQPSECLAAQGDGQSCVAGYDLDALVDDKVMRHCVGGVPHHRKQTPCYSTDIAAAMEVVEKVGDVVMTNRGWAWFVEFFRAHDDAPLGNATSYSLPEAICRAALAAVHNEREK